MLDCYDLVVIGGGPAGLIAAGIAVKDGSSVLIVDKNDCVGKKLSITGKGRCNITNNCSVQKFIESVVTNNKFLFSAGYNFTPEDTISFFEKLGLKTKTERGNRVFPVSDKALDVVKCMEKFAFGNGCEFLKGKVSKILTKGKNTTGIVCNNKDYYAKNILIACGGTSYPGTGSTGDGYKLAKELGHTIVKPMPSLVPLVSDEVFCKDLQGLSLKNISLTLFENNKVTYNDFGDMLFTHFGVSGPLILSASSHIKNFKNCYIIIDLKPALSYDQLEKRIQRDFNEFKNKMFQNSLNKLLPQKLIPVIVDLSNILPDKPCNSITKSERDRLVKLLKNFKVNINSFRPINEAIITRGGINTLEINPKTMQSKLINGLFFAGEVIDVDAYTGGYNLQIAFCTGYTAGKNIKK